MSYYDYDRIKIPASFDKINLDDWYYNIDPTKLGKEWMKELKKNADYEKELTYQIIENKNGKIREKDLEIENLKLKLELEKLKNSASNGNVQDEETLKIKRRDIVREKACNDNSEPNPGILSKPTDPSIPMDNGNIPLNNVNKGDILDKQKIKEKERDSNKDFSCNSNKSLSSDNVLEKVTIEEIEEEYKHGGECLDVDSKTILMDAEEYKHGGECLDFDSKTILMDAE